MQAIALGTHPIHLGPGGSAPAPGDYAINPAGVWHTADTATGANCVFITTGIGTEHRPR